MAPRGVKRAEACEEEELMRKKRGRQRKEEAQFEEEEPVKKKRGKKAKDDGMVLQQCKDVVAGLKKAEALPGPCKEFLINSVKPNLSTIAAERHQYQNQAVDMVGETLNGVREHMQTAVQKFQAEVDGFDAE